MNQFIDLVVILTE